GVATGMMEVRTWEGRRAFLVIIAAGATRVLVDEGLPPIPGAAIIAEYLDELCGDTFARRLLPRQAAQRIEVRRLMSWFNDKFFAEVSGPLTAERLYKRHVPLDAGGGPPETDVLRAARNNIRYHMAYIGWLARSRDWLAG